MARKKTTRTRTKTRTKTPKYTVTGNTREELVRNLAKVLNWRSYVVGAVTNESEVDSCFYGKVTDAFGVWKRTQLEMEESFRTPESLPSVDLAGVLGLAKETTPEKRAH